MNTLARSTDPDTSKEAGEAIQSHLPRLHAWTVECVTKKPGLTQAELGAIFCALDPRKIGRRLPECVRKGLIKVGPIRKCTITKRSAQTYEPVEKGG